jgi:TfoX/Sxy family transcriptional regulator of competence genes
MASTQDFIEFVCEQIQGIGVITYRKMFGEYMVYVNAKPILLICDNIVYVKMKDEIKEYMEDVETGIPYHGAKPHYILDIENFDLTREILPILERITEIPKSKSKK